MKRQRICKLMREQISDISIWNVYRSEHGDGKKRFGIFKACIVFSNLHGQLCEQFFCKICGKEKGARETPLRSDGTCNEENDTSCFLCIKEWKSLRKTEHLISE